MKISYVVPVVIMIFLTGCATQGSLDNVRNDIDAVKTRIFSVERDLGGVRADSKESIGSVEKSVKADVSIVRKMSADIQATIDSTKGEIQALNGRVDDMASAIKKQTEDLTRYREDADKRIFALEDRILKQQTAIEELSKKLSGDIPSTPDALYMKGLETFKSGDMPSAREQFTKFLEENPQHDLAANAHYWIGETYYSEKNYESAILAYQEVIKNYPGKEKVAAAMLKQAMTFRDIKDNKSAKYVLKKLAEGFPKSAEAKKARDLLKEIR